MSFSGQDFCLYGITTCYALFEPHFHQYVHSLLRILQLLLILNCYKKRTLYLIHYYPCVVECSIADVSLGDPLGAG